MRSIPVPAPLVTLWLNARQPEHTARYYPSDTTVYAWLTLAPGGQQFEHFKDIFDRSQQSRNLRRLKDDCLEEFARETNIYIEDDVATWAGPDLSVSWVDYDNRHDLP